MSTEKYALFYFSLIPNLYYFVIAYFLPKSKNTELQSELILILCFQIVILIIASFESFWMAFNFRQKEFTSIQLVILSLVIIGILAFAYKAYENIKAQFNGLFGIITIITLKKYFRRGILLGRRDAVQITNSAWGYQLYETDWCRVSRSNPISSIPGSSCRRLV